MNEVDEIFNKTKKKTKEKLPLYMHKKNNKPKIFFRNYQPRSLFLVFILNTFS